MLGIPIRDATSGYRAYRADMLQDDPTSRTPVAKGYGFQIELCYRCRQYGGRIAEVPITFTDRVRGNSKMSAYIMAEDMLLVTWWGIRDRALKLWRLLPFARQA